MSRRVTSLVSAILLASLLSLSSALPVSARIESRFVAPGAQITGVAVLNAHGHVQAHFHRGDRVGLRIRWIVRRVRPGTHIVVLWALRHGRKVVYRHFDTVLTRAGRYRLTIATHIPRLAQLGSYTFEGKIVVGHVATFRIFTVRVIR